ncbi:hypothetical protein RYX36_015376 [Vicia faba]
MVSILSLLVNGISQFLPQPISQVVKGSHVHVKLNPNSTKSRPSAFKVRANNYDDDHQVDNFLKRDYKWGFNQEIDSFSLPKGLSEETIRLISARKNEPNWMLNLDLKHITSF